MQKERLLNVWNIQCDALYIAAYDLVTKKIRKVKRKEAETE